MGSHSGEANCDQSSSSEWNENEIAIALTAIVASASVMGAAEYYRRYCIKASPRSSHIERNKFINGIIKKSDVDCLTQLRMSRDKFFELCFLIRDENLLSDSRRCSLEEQVVLFLHTIDHNVRNRVIGYRFSRSGETVNRYFHRVIDAVIGLYPEYVKFTGLHTPKEISNNPTWSSYFEIQIGKYYVVFVSKVPGICEKWELARAQVEGFSGCKQQSFKSYASAVTKWTRFKVTLQNVGSSANPTTPYRASAITNEDLAKRVESESASFYRLASNDEDEVGVHHLDQLNSEVNRVDTEVGIMDIIFKVLIGVVLIYAVIS